MTRCVSCAVASAAALLIAFAAPARAQQQASAQVQTTPPIRPPLVNRANDVLPAWLRVRGEFRERMEGVDGFGFTPARDDLYWLSRLRLNAAVTASTFLSFQAQVQDARVADKTVGPNNAAPFHGTIDLRLGFADIGTPASHVSARVGRQELAYGDQRLLGHLAWTNTARSFDAGRLTLRRKHASVDLFGGSVVRILPDEFDKSGSGNRISGAYGSIGALIPKGVIEPYVIWRRDQNLKSESGPFGVLHQVTTGARAAGTLPATVDYTIEMARQDGSLGLDAVRAWAGHWQARKTFPGKKTPRLIGEYNYASGDGNPADGVRGTFDQLYPTGHDKYGLADQVGWRNTRHVRAGFELTPVKGLPVSTSYHSWWLADRHDGLYAASGALIARIPTGATDTHVGQEIDVQASRALTPQLQLAAGYAHIFSGPFLKQATPGAAYSQPYVMVTYVFLAEK